MSIRVHVRTAVVMSLALFAGATNSSASPILVVSRAALGGNDSFDWSALGSEGTIVADPVNVSSTGATRSATLNNPNGAFRRIDEFPAGSWNGSFASGDALLWTNFNSPGPMQITFNSPVFGAGAQINDDFQSAFVATLNVYDTSNVLLASFSLPGVTTPTHDNSAVFLGVTDSVAEIGRIDYLLTNGHDFAINRLDIDTVGPAAPPSGAVPEPASLLLVASGLIGAAYRRRH